MQLTQDYEAMVPFPLSLKKFTSWIQIWLQSMLNLYPSEKSSLSIYLLYQIKQTRILYKHEWLQMYLQNQTNKTNNFHNK